MRLLAWWDWGFESRRKHGCRCLGTVVCCQVETSATALSLAQRNPTECGVSWVWSCTLDNEEALVHWEMNENFPRSSKSHSRAMEVHRHQREHKHVWLHSQNLWMKVWWLRTNTVRQLTLHDTHKRYIRIEASRQCAHNSSEYLLLTLKYIKCFKNCTLIKTEA